MTTEPKVPALPEALAQNVEWAAYAIRAERLLEKQGKHIKKIKLSGQEKAILADYALACTFTTPPLHRASGAIIPPILYGYGEAEDAFGISRDQLYGMRSRKCPAFANNIILTASLADALAKEPNPKPVPLSLVHTGARGKYTPELAESIIKSLRHCPMLSVVAKAHGLNRMTLENWRKKGEAGERRYVDFFSQCEAAIAESQMGLVGAIASNDDWRAKRAALELTDPETFKPQQAVELTGKDGGPIRTDAPPPLTITLQGLTGHTYDPAFAPQPEATGEPQTKEPA